RGRAPVHVDARGAPTRVAHDHLGRPGAAAAPGHPRRGDEPGAGRPGTVTRAVRPLIMGVVNVTPDSFSDGGRWLDPDAAIAHGLQLARQGADILDVGGESTRPGAARPPLEVERERVLP